MFPTDTTGLADAATSEAIDLADGAEFRLTISPVRKQIGEHTLRMLGYNGSVPGPTLRVPEGAEIQVKVENRGDLDATVHWHGLRLDNALRRDARDAEADGDRRRASPTGCTARTRALYWYHPHIREDYGQELGLYGNLIVVPRDADYWAPAHREVAVTLDDILIEDGKVAPFRARTPPMRRWAASAT